MEPNLEWSKKYGNERVSNEERVERENLVPDGFLLSPVGLRNGPFIYTRTTYYYCNLASPVFFCSYIGKSDCWCDGAENT